MTTSCGGYKCQIEGTDPFDPFDPFDYCHNSPGFGRGVFCQDLHTDPYFCADRFS